jgi:predicted phage baseplate assembly protein
LQALSWLGPNTVGVRQSVAQANEQLGVGNGQPNQTFTLAFKPVVDGTLKVAINEDGVAVAWTEVANFDASTERDSHFTVDRALGIVTVGDGLQGRVIPDGATVTATAYEYGGGLAGNVQPGAISKIDPAPGSDTGSLDNGKTANPAPTIGGSETETVEQARRRVPRILRHQDRAVTADDFRELCLMTPGVVVGRAEVLPLYRPGAPASTKFPGVVSVLVVPAEDPLHPRAPIPDRNFREAVCTYLDRHRLITTELYVIGPRYQPVAVSVGIQAKPGYAIEQLTKWICLALYQYFAPLPPFGPDAQGWPLGGRINRGAVEAVVLQVEGVAWVEEVALYRVINDQFGAPVEQINLGIDMLPELVQIDVDLNRAPPPQPLPPTGKVAVPVPAPRTSC